MDAGKVSRRDVLKLLGIAPLSFVKWPQPDLKIRYLPENKIKRSPNVLVLVFDALSAKHMSLHGYHRQTTPNIERFAQKATVFHRHYAGGNFTTPGTASLLTGVYPWSHRGLALHGTVEDTYVERNIFSLFAASHNTFAYSHNPLVNILFHQFYKDINQLTRVSELCLASDSYADKLFRSDYSAAYSGELLVFRKSGNPTSSFFLSRFERLKRYFSWLFFTDAYRDIFPRGVPNHWDEMAPSYSLFTLETAIDWIKSQLEERPEPFLGYVHLFPPHNPYSTRHDFVDRFDDGWSPMTKPKHPLSENHDDEFLVEQRRLYDEYIAYVDAEFGRLYDFLERTRVLDDTYLVFTSDHGEMFERGIYTHLTPTLYEPIIHIPLLISTPGRNQRQDVYTPTSCVDVLPTLLDLAGKPIPKWCEGQVLPMDGSQIADDERSIFVVEAKENPTNAPLEKATIALIKGPYKLEHYYGYDGYQNEYELYDVKNDPEELVNLYPSLRSIAKSLQDELIAKNIEVNRHFR